MIASNQSMFDPKELPSLLAAIGQGWRMGETARSLFAQKWEETWDKPPIQWRTELNIQPIQNH